MRYLSLTVIALVLSFTSFATGPISGPTQVCAGGTITLSNAIPGGTWTSSNPAVASITSAGVVTDSSGSGGSSTVITYDDGSGPVTATIYVYSLPATYPIIGGGAYCSGAGVYIWLNGSQGGVNYQLYNGGIPVGAPVAGFSSGSAINFPPQTNTGTYSVMATNTTTSCTAGMTGTAIITAGTMPAPITGPTSVCIGNTIMLTSNTAGGTWATSAPATATVHINTGAVTGVMAGVADVTYTTGAGCISTMSLTVTPGPGPITGPTAVCAGDNILLSCSPAGGTWSSANTAVASVTGTGVVTGGTMGTTNISYTAGGCNTTTLITVTASLPVTASAAQACGSLYTLSAAGGTTYSWSPAAGLSCSTCATTTTNITSTATYTVASTSAGCSGTATTTAVMNADQISGYITYTGAATDSFRVWLIKYNPLDSTVTALDSTVTCMDAGTPYYQFFFPAPGSYMIKAKLFGTVPGTSGYIPTYGLSSATWNTASSVTHASPAIDTMHINMLLGTVPSGPGFISGNVYYGAGRRTTGEAPAPDMLIFLKNAAGDVLTYTYTDAMGAYSFSNLAYGDYVIYPEEFEYYTTPSGIITLNAATPSATGTDFKQHTDYGTITPFDATGVKTVTNNNGVRFFPNPSSGGLTIRWNGFDIGPARISVSDMTGREVFLKDIDMLTANGETSLNLANIMDGIYLVTLRSGNSYFSHKLLIRK